MRYVDKTFQNTTAIVARDLTARVRSKSAIFGLWDESRWEIVIVITSSTQCIISENLKLQAKESGSHSDVYRNDAVNP